MPDKNKLKRPIDLASLYPTPKTYDQKESEQKALDAKRLARQPKHIGLMSATSLSLVFIFTLWISATIPGLAVGNPYFGVPASFCLGFMWCGLVYWAINDLTKMLAVKSYSPKPFFLVYAACVTPLIALGSEFHGSIMVSLVLTLVHFLVVCLLVAVAYTSKLSAGRKIAILSGIWTSAFISVIIFSINFMV